MTLASIVRTRLTLWRQACDAWGLEIDPPFTRETLSRVSPGWVAFRAHLVGGSNAAGETVSLTVIELWQAGGDPHGDRRLEHEGCSAAILSWHLQVIDEAGPRGAERLDVVETPDPTHPRIHRHPYGQPNETREPSDLPPPDAWLHRVDSSLGGLLSAGLAIWDPDEQE
jgi:hypothetical protein